MKSITSYLLCFLTLSILLVSSCRDDDMMDTDAPIASFQFEVGQSNFLEVTFSNFSQNASTYAWDFGDGNTATDENPVHTYAAAGDYEVRLTAFEGDESSFIIKTVMVVDPNSQIKKLTGETSKVWKLSRNIDGMEYPLQVGPEDFSQIWWAYGLNEPVGTRACIMEEEYIFGLDGTYTYDSKGSVYADVGVWNADIHEQCVDANDPAQMTGVNGEDLSAWGSGDFTYDFDPTAGTLTLNGLGAHVGLPKVATNEEVTVPVNSVTYSVISLETSGPVDKLVLQTTIPGGYWQFFLVSYDNPADEPELPGAPPTASFTHEVDGSTATFTNTSVNADSYSWDFGDGNMSSEESPMHTYASDGSYNVVLTATNGDGSTMSAVNVVIANNSVFSAATFNGGSSKTWKLNPAAGALSVGPSAGSGEWFATSDDDVMTRACTFDDEYIFDSANNFEYVTNGDVWAEAYMGVDPPTCVTEDMLSADAAAWGAGTHTYTVTEASGDDPAFITVTGTGAFIALPKAFNGGEYAAGPPVANGAVTYEVLSYVNDGSQELLVLTIDISEGQIGGAYWTFTLVSE